MNCIALESYMGNAPIAALKSGQDEPRWQRIGRTSLRGLLVVVALLCIIYCDLIKGHAVLLYWQWTCLHHKNSGAPISFAFGHSQPPPASWTNFRDANGRDFDFGYDNDNGIEVLFLGRMKRPDGAERLVEVDAGVMVEGGGRQGNVWLWNSDGTMSTKKDLDRIGIVSAIVMRPAGLVGNAIDCWDSSELDSETSAYASLPYNSKADSAHNTTCGGAVLDPANPSHLTMQVNFSDGTSNPIDGYLDNNDVLTIRQRTPP